MGEGLEGELAVVGADTALTDSAERKSGHWNHDPQRQAGRSE